MLHHASSFGQGFKNFLAGFSFLMARPRLWWLAIVPSVLGVAMLIAMFTSFFHYYGDIHAWIIGNMGDLRLDDPAAWWMYVLNALLWVVDLVLQLLVILVSMLLILLVFYVATMIIAAPFNDMLSERVEEIVTGRPAPRFSLVRIARETAHTMWVEFLKALLFIGVPVVMLVLFLIPVAGGMIYLVAMIVFGMWDLGFTYVDYPMGRESMSFCDRMSFAWRHKVALVGFGWVFIIPLASFFLIAPMTVGGTLLYIRCEGNHAAEAD